MKTIRDTNLVSIIFLLRKLLDPIDDGRPCLNMYQTIIHTENCLLELDQNRL